MKKTTLTSIVLIMTLLGVVFATFGSAAPALAQDTTPVAPTLPDPNVDATVIVPDTGGDVDTDNDGFVFSGWTLLLILGIVVVVLLVALLARGGTTHIHD